MTALQPETAAVAQWASDLAGYSLDAAAQLGEVFPASGQGMRTCALPFAVRSEESLLIVRGVLWIGYLPDASEASQAGLIALADTLARRLNSPGRMAGAAADAIQAKLQPKGCAALVKSWSPYVPDISGAVEYRGCLLSDPYRREFLELCA